MSAVGARGSAGPPGIAREVYANISRAPSTVPEPRAPQQAVVPVPGGTPTVVAVPTPTVVAPNRENLKDSDTKNGTENDEVSKTRKSQFLADLEAMERGEKSWRRSTGVRSGRSTVGSVKATEADAQRDDNGVIDTQNIEMKLDLLADTSSDSEVDEKETAALLQRMDSKTFIEGEREFGLITDIRARRPTRSSARPEHTLFLGSKEHTAGNAATDRKQIESNKKNLKTKTDAATKHQGSRLITTPTYICRVDLSRDARVTRERNHVLRRTSQSYRPEGYRDPVTRDRMRGVGPQLSLPVANKLLRDKKEKTRFRYKLRDMEDVVNDSDLLAYRRVGVFASVDDAAASQNNAKNPSSVPFAGDGQWFGDDGYGIRELGERLAGIRISSVADEETVSLLADDEDDDEDDFSLRKTAVGGTSSASRAALAKEQLAARTRKVREWEEMSALEKLSHLAKKPWKDAATCCGGRRGRRCCQHFTFFLMFWLLLPWLFTWSMNRFVLNLHGDMNDRRAPAQSDSLQHGKYHWWWDWSKRDQDKQQAASDGWHTNLEYHLSVAQSGSRNWWDRCMDFVVDMLVLSGGRGSNGSLEPCPKWTDSAAPHKKGTDYGAGPGLLDGTYQENAGDDGVTQWQQEFVAQRRYMAKASQANPTVEFQIDSYQNPGSLLSTALSSTGPGYSVLLCGNLNPPHS